jgi:fused signal recognition particle receptor
MVVTPTRPTRSLAGRLRQGLARTREVLTTPVGELVGGPKGLREEDLEGLEEALLGADVGLDATQALLENLRARRADVATPATARAVLREAIEAQLDLGNAQPAFASVPWVVLVVGVNGVGKTTTIGKLAHTWREAGRTSLLCAADTFRAAAAEQLEIWAERAGGAFLRGAEGADPSAVLTDGLRAARARGHAGVLVDTAGRLHTKGNLMAELSKMRRVAEREIQGAPHETLLVLDATVGSNGLAQAREFARAAGVTGLILTKLDGTAKGGVALAIVREIGVPIQYVGVGEGIGDLLPFDPAAYAAGLVGD